MSNPTLADWRLVRWLGYANSPLVLVGLVAPLKYQSYATGLDAARWLWREWQIEPRLFGLEPVEVWRQFGEDEVKLDPILPPPPMWWPAYQTGGNAAVGAPPWFV